MTDGFEQEARDLVERGGGGSQAVELLGPFPIAFDTPGLDNPAGNGALVGPVIPAGSLVLSAWILTTVDWTATVSVDEVDITLNTSGIALLSKVTNPASELNSAHGYAISLADAPAEPVVLRGADQIAVAFYSTANLTAGAGNVYALTVLT